MNVAHTIRYANSASWIEGKFTQSNVTISLAVNGTVTAKLDVVAHAFSKTAEEAIVAAGGTVTKL